MSNTYFNEAYGSTQPLLTQAPFPISLPTAPDINNKGIPGTLWLNKSTDAAYVLVSVTNNQANWINIGNGAGTFTSLTVDPGNLTITAGNLIVTAGSGTFGASVSAGTFMIAGTTVTAGTNLITTNGNLLLNKSTAIGTITGSPNIQCSVSRSGNTVQVGDILSAYRVFAQTSSASLEAARIQSTCISVSSVIGADLQFLTSPGIGGVTSRMVLSSAGNLTINAPDSGTGLTIAGGGLTVVGAPSGVTAGQVGYTATTAAVTTPGSVVASLAVNVGGTLRYIALYDAIT